MTDPSATEAVHRWRRELSTKGKNGVNFILAAAVIWSLVAFVWTLPYSAYDRSILTFIAASLLLPLAWALSKVLRAQWSIAGNPLEPLGLWLNFAQLCYFPILIFILLRYPDHFVMTFAIITGAHMLPYAWLYDEKPYAAAAVTIPLGALLLELFASPRAVILIPAFVAVTMAVLACALYASCRHKSRACRPSSR